MVASDFGATIFLSYIVTIDFKTTTDTPVSPGI